MKLGDNMQNMNETVNYLKCDVDANLMDSYVKALKNDKFKALVARLKLKEKDAIKYTSKLERTVSELNNCEKCKHLFECKNEVEGFVYYPEKYDGRLKFSYVACKYKKKELKKEQENKSIFYEMPSEIKKASWNGIINESGKRLKTIEFLTEFYKNYGVKSVKGCYLHGSFGCGKSYLVAALLNELAKKDIKVIIMYYPEMLRRLKESFNDGDAFANYMKELKCVDILMIDDIGAETVTPWNRDEVLGTILQYRMDNNLPTFFTSNFTIDELESHFVNSNNKDDIVKARRIMERIKYLTEDIEIISENRRKS